MEQDQHKGMQRKTIKRVIDKKIEAWLNTIDDVILREHIKSNTIVTGGCIASMLLGENVNDFDIYFRDKETTKLVAEYYVKEYRKKHRPDLILEVREEDIVNIKGETENRVTIYAKSAGVVGEQDGEDQSYEYFEMTDTPDGDRAQEYIDQFAESEDGEEEDYRPVFLSQNAISLSNKLQIVIRFYGEPTEIHNNYDFIHATAHYDIGKGDLVIPAEAMESLLSKDLKYKGSLYPICSVFRARKFMARGWKISAGELLKMCFQISEINLTDIPTLREQLTGVDAAYFHQLISWIEHYKEAAEEAGEDPKDIDSTYIAQLIDEVFG